MISEGNKVFVRCSGKATGMDTIFGHYFEVTDDGKISAMTTYDDTLTAFNSMKKINKKEITHEKLHSNTHF